MKKILSHILILVIFVQALFTPFSFIHAAGLPTGSLDNPTNTNGFWKINVSLSGDATAWSNVDGYGDNGAGTVDGDALYIKINTGNQADPITYAYIGDNDGPFNFGSGNITIQQTIPLTTTTDITYYLKLFADDNGDASDELLDEVSFSFNAQGILSNSSSLTQYQNTPVDQTTGAQDANVDPAKPTETAGGSWSDCGASASGILACIINVLTLPILYLIYWVSSLFVSIIAQVSDFVLYLSINDALFRSEFVQQGWALVRDIANLGFIFVLLITAFETVLGIGKSDAKKVIANVIIIAVCINFSLFVSKVIIDAGNVVARIFYSRINVEDKSDGQAQENFGQEKAISVALVSQVNPQRIMGSLDTYTKSNEPMSDSSGQDIQQDPIKKSIVRVVIFIIVIMINFAILFTFTSITWLFIGRILELWLLMITGPLAFISYISPRLRVKDFDFSTWFSRLLSLSFMPAVYCFFLYIIIKFFGVITNAFSSFSANPDNGFWASIILAALPVLLLMGLIDKIGGIVESFAGTVSKEVKAKLNIATGAVGMVAAARGARVLQNTVGRASELSADRRAALEERAANGSMVARMELQSRDYLSKSSFDVRNSGLGQTFQKKSGFDFNTGSETLKSYTFGLADMGSKATEGGYQGMQEKKKDELRDKVDAVKTKLTDEQLQDVDTSTPAERQKYKEEKSKWDKDFEAKVKANRSDPNSFAAKEAQFKLTNPTGTYTKEMYKEFYSKEVMAEPIPKGNNKAMKERYEADVLRQDNEYKAAQGEWTKEYEKVKNDTGAMGFAAMKANYERVNPDKEYTEGMYKKEYIETFKKEEPKKPEDIKKPDYVTKDTINSRRTEQYTSVLEKQKSTYKGVELASSVIGGKGGHVGALNEVIAEAKKETAKKDKKRKEINDKIADLKKAEKEVADEIKKAGEEIADLTKSVEKFAQALTDTSAGNGASVTAVSMDSTGKLTNLKTYPGIGSYPGADDEERMKNAVRDRTGDLQLVDQKISEARSEMQRYASTKDGAGAQQYKDAQEKIKIFTQAKSAYEDQIDDIKNAVRNKEQAEKEIKDAKEFIDRKKRMSQNFESQIEKKEEELKKVGAAKTKPEKK